MNEEKWTQLVEEIMEQWNSKEDVAEMDEAMQVSQADSEATKKFFESCEKDKISLRKIYEKRYLDYLSKKIGIDCEYLKGKTVLEKINQILLQGDESDIQSMENYIKSKDEKLFDMLNMVIPNCRSKLHVKGKVVYALNSHNALFFNTLLDLYEEKNPNCTNLLKKRYDSLDDDFKFILETGFEDLAKNDSTVLSLDEFRAEWNLKFNIYYKEVLSLLDDVDVAVKCYVKNIVPNEENKDTFEKIKEILFRCAECIKLIAEDKMEYPDIDIDEVMNYAKERRENKRARSERAKEAWKKRKSENK